MPQTNKAAAATGSRLDALVALRDYLADALDQTMSARDQGTLSARYMECLAQIEELAPPEKEVDPLADLVPEDN